MNLFDIPVSLPDEEIFNPLVPDHGIGIERIVSSGQVTPEGKWYDQDRDEWVALLQGTARIAYDDGLEVTLERGDHLIIPARRRHKVTYTSADPPCIWLALHGSLLPRSQSPPS